MIAELLLVGSSLASLAFAFMAWSRGSRIEHKHAQLVSQNDQLWQRLDAANAQLERYAEAEAEEWRRRHLDLLRLVKPEPPKGAA